MKKIISILCLVMLIFITGCGKSEEIEDRSESKEKTKKLEKIQNDLEIEKDDENITSGSIEGYKFKVTDKKTDKIVIEMENGDIMLAVLSNKDAPKTIANFKSLVAEHFYDGLTFHRVVKGFMIQTGDPTGTGFGGADKKIKGEFSANGVKNSLSHTRGVISMARNGKDMDSASSQFFICQEDSTFLDGNYASFGKVFAGLDVVDAIADVEVKGETPVEKPVIKSIRFIELQK